ncbi:FimD/PapC N-terminal domain-containing protein, partial [Enterobacter hormaechei]
GRSTSPLSPLTLNFTVPQSAMRALPRGYVSPESWESGIPAAWLNYVVNGANNDYRGETRTREQQLFVSCCSTSGRSRLPVVASLTPISKRSQPMAL